MSQELGEALSVVRVTVEGVPMVIKGTYKSIQDFINFINTIWAKTFGKEKEKLKEFMAQPGEKQYLALNDEDIEKLTNSLDKANIPYIEIPDFNTSDGRKAIMFRGQDFVVIEAMVEDMVKDKKLSNPEFFKTFEEYKEVYGEGWTEEMEKMYKDQVELPTVEIATLVNKNGSLSPEEIRAELKNSGKYTDKQINLAIEAAIKDNLIKPGEKGNYDTVKNFNETLTEHYEKTALMRGKALHEDERFIDAQVYDDLLLSDEELSKWELPETDIENGLILNYYRLPGKSDSVVAVPKEHIGAAIDINSHNSTKPSRAVFFSQNSNYKVYDLKPGNPGVPSFLKKEEDKKKVTVRKKTGEDLTNEFFLFSVWGSNRRAKDKKEDKSKKKEMNIAEKEPDKKKTER